MNQLALRAGSGKTRHERANKLSAAVAPIASSKQLPKRIESVDLARQRRTSLSTGFPQSHCHSAQFRIQFSEQARQLRIQRQLAFDFLASVTHSAMVATEILADSC